MSQTPRCGRWQSDVGWYLLGQPRMVQRVLTQLLLDTITVKVDSDRAGYVRTRRSSKAFAACLREAPMGDAMREMECQHKNFVQKVNAEGLQFVEDFGLAQNTSGPPLFPA